MKDCRECKYYRASENAHTYDRCLFRHNIANPLEPDFTILQRRSGWLIAWLWNECGYSGRFWTAKEAK